MCAVTRLTERERSGNSPRLSGVGSCAALAINIDKINNEASRRGGGGREARFHWINNGFKKGCAAAGGFPPEGAPEIDRSREYRYRELEFAASARSPGLISM